MKSKNQKRIEAAERQAKYDSLSLEEKIAKVKKQSGRSIKQLKKLKML